MRITVVSSGLMTTQALTSGASAPCACATSFENGTRSPSAKPPPAAAEATTNVRRDNRADFAEIVFVMADSSTLTLGGLCGGALAGGEMHRGADALIGAAAADIGHRGVDVLVGGLGRLGEQRRGRHDLPRLAITALRHVELGPRLLHRMRCVGRQALDGDDLVALLHGRERDRTRPLHLAVDMHRARSALRNSAAELGAGETDLLADHPQERRLRLCLHVPHLAIDVEPCHGRPLPMCRRARRLKVMPAAACEWDRAAPRQSTARSIGRKWGCEASRR